MMPYKSAYSNGVSYTGYASALNISWTREEEDEIKKHKK